MKYLRASFFLEGDIYTSETRNISFDIICSLAGECGFESFEIEGDHLRGYVQEDLFEKEHLTELLESFPMPGINVKYIIEKADYKDWNKPWEEAGFEPIEVDGKCIIHDTKHAVSVSEDMMEIIVDAEMAFGSGTHATTRMIVSEILTSDIQGKRILDCGCGTGILSIVASKCGAKNVVAYDIDEWSVKNTMHNAQLNGISNIDVLNGDINILSHISGVFDLVVANINRNILLSDMPAIKDVMTTNGKLIISGFYEEDAPKLIEKAKQLGLQIESKRVSDNWVSLSFSS